MRVGKGREEEGRGGKGKTGWKGSWRRRVGKKKRGREGAMK